MSKILGVYGGTFSPPHLGHLNAAKAFVQAVQPEKMLIIPSYIPPHKEVETPVSCEERVEMCRLAFGELPNVEINEMEINRGGKSYTVDTLRCLADAYPEYQIAFLIGTDMMLTLDQWYQPEEIFSLCDMYCVRRENISDLDAQILEKNAEYLARFGKKVTFIDAPVLEISSSEVREALAHGSQKKWLAPEVEAFIRERGLYL